MPFMKERGERGGARPFARIRHVLLWLLVLLVGGLWALYHFGRQRPTEAASQPAGESLPLGETTAASQGFEFTQVVEGKPVFRIRGGQFRADRDQRIHLETVGLTLFRPDGEVGVESRKAEYDEGQRTAHLEGDVKLTGPRGLTLSTNALDLGNQGQSLVSRDAVRFSWNNAVEGEALGLRFDLTAGTFVLEGNVRLHSLPGAERAMTLTADRLAYDRQERNLRAEGSVDVTWGQSHMQAPRISLLLAEDERTPRFLRAAWQVAGELAPEGADAEARQIRFGATTLSAEFEEAQKTLRYVELEGAPGERSFLEADSAVGLTRRVAARNLTIRFREGKPATAQAFRPVQFKEFAQDDASHLLRWATALRADAEFDAASGNLSNLTLTEDLDLREERIHATGTKGFFNLSEGTGEIFGAPAQMQTDRGDLAAPRIAYQQAGGRVHARGGVRALLQRGEQLLVGGPASGSGGPVRVESKQAILRDDEQTFIFLGNVQAYQGENVLFAEQLRGDEKGRRMAASGGVKTIWRPEPGPTATASAKPPEPIEVTATGLTYQRDEKLLVYDGEVHLAQANRTLTCQRLETVLDDEQRARELTARGKVVLDDPQTRRTATGEVAKYDLAARTVTVTGDPVVLSDRDGNQVKGRHLLYEVDGGAMKISSEVP